MIEGCLMLVCFLGCHCLCFVSRCPFHWYWYKSISELPIYHWHIYITW